MDFVGVNIKKLKDGSYELTQRTLIDSIINDVKLKDAKVKPVPAKVSLQLQAFKDKPFFRPQLQLQVCSWQAGLPSTDY